MQKSIASLIASVNDQFVAQVDDDAWGSGQVALTQLRNDLVANVTHELKTPLSSTRLFVETLLNSPSLNEQTAREYLQLIAQENLRCSIVKAVA